MEPTFRASMNWLHTWAGVVLGGVLFVIFWMGSLSVFDREIDRWMAPTTRIALPHETASLDAMRPSIDAAVAAKSGAWSVLYPTERQPVFREAYRGKDGFVVGILDPATGAALPDPGTFAGTRFLYPFHYSLHLRIWDIGYWVVGLAGMAMLALCVTGVVIHRKIFAEFFTFRPEKKARRSILDLHNLAGVLGLPFHFIISLSGLIIFFSLFPLGLADRLWRRDRAVQSRDLGHLHPSEGQPGGAARLARRHDRRGAAPMGRRRADVSAHPQSR